MPKETRSTTVANATAVAESFRTTFSGSSSTLQSSASSSTSSMSVPTGETSSPSSRTIATIASSVIAGSIVVIALVAWFVFWLRKRGMQRRKNDQEADRANLVQDMQKSEWAELSAELQRVEMESARRHAELTADRDRMELEAARSRVELG